MSRPTRNETLKALEWADPKTDYEYKVVQAAKAYAAMAPDTCPCPGCDFGHHISAGGGGSKCSKCIGGYVWPDKLIETIGWEVAQRTHSVLSVAEVVAVLGVLWEVGNDN